jgi:hypothetical protein
MDSAEDVFEGSAIADMDAVEREVTPAAYCNVKAAASLIDNDMPGMIPQHEPVASKKQRSDRLDAVRLIEVQRPNSPMCGLKE